MRLVTTSGPEFAKKWTAAQAVFLESRLEGFKRTFLTSVGDQRPHHSVAKQGHFAGQVSCNAPAVVAIRPTESAKI